MAPYKFDCTLLFIKIRYHCDLVLIYLHVLLPPRATQLAAFLLE